MCYLRDVLVTKAHRDPDVTAFLACWSYEEHWHGDAIAKVLGAHGELAGSARLAKCAGACRSATPCARIMFSIGSTITNLTAVHMAWGAVNEWTTQAGYARLCKRPAPGAERAVATDHAAGRPPHRLLRLRGEKTPRGESLVPADHPKRPRTFLEAGRLRGHAARRSALLGVTPLRRRRRREGRPAYRQACGPIPRASKACISSRRRSRR